MDLQVGEWLRRDASWGGLSLVQKRPSRGGVCHARGVAADDPQLLRDIARLQERNGRDVAAALLRGRDEMMLALSEVIDDCDRALDALGGVAASDRWRMGIEQVRDRALQRCARHGYVAVSPIGEAFDPQRHEAVSVDRSAGLPHQITAVTRRGWMRGDFLLVPAQVIVRGEAEVELVAEPAPARPPGRSEERPAARATREPLPTQSLSPADSPTTPTPEAGRQGASSGVRPATPTAAPRLRDAPQQPRQEQAGKRADATRREPGSGGHAHNGRRAPLRPEPSDQEVEIVERRRRRPSPRTLYVCPYNTPGCRGNCPYCEADRA